MNNDILLLELGYYARLLEAKLNYYNQLNDDNISEIKKIEIRKNLNEIQTLIDICESRNPLFKKII